MSLNKYDPNTKQLTPIAGGFDVAGIINDIGDLDNLQTTAKSSLVAAVNEVKGSVPSLDSAPTQNSTNAVQSGGVYSAEKALSDTMAANGAHNLLPCVISSHTDRGVTFTVNSDLSITLSGQLTESAEFYKYYALPTPIPAGQYIFSTGQDSRMGMFLVLSGGLWVGVGDVDTNETIVTVGFAIGANADFTTPLTIYPLLKLSSDPSTEYTPYAMTNRELTERMTKKASRIMGVYTKDHIGQFALFCPYDVANKGLPTVVAVDLRYKGDYYQDITIENYKNNGFWVSASDAPQSNDYLGYIGEAICS